MRTFQREGLSRREFCAAAMGLMLGAERLVAEEDAVPFALRRVTDATQNVVNQTAGGKQFWADIWFFHDWRIQRNVLTGHCRLLDGDNRRHTFGSYEACQQRLDEIRRRDQLPPMQGRAIVVLHGLFRTRAAMESLRKALLEGGDYSVFCIGYPTTRGSIADHAQSLDSVVRSLEGIHEVNFVAHSLGNLVVRHWLHDLADQKRALPDGQSFGRMVMLTPPNQHPQLAANLVRGRLAEFVAGAAAEQLATGWEALEPSLATPHFDFGILAGGKGDDRGYNPLLPGDDDGVITVESTRLGGARDFRRLPVLHTFFMNDRRVHEYSLRFLAHGFFEGEDTRQPIDAVEPMSAHAAGPPDRPVSVGRKAESAATDLSSTIR